MRTINSIINEAKRVATVASLTGMLFAGTAGSAHADLCTTLASDNFNDVVTTSIMVSPNGIAGECGDICTEWSKLCTSVLVGHNRCLSGVYKSLLKTYTKYCKMMTNPVEQAECKGEVAAAKAQAKTLIKADTALVKARCAGYVVDCHAYCVANS